MKLADLADLAKRTPPRAWADADNIPWNEPGFSERMLREHLSQHHDRASRRTSRIDRQVRWLHEEILHTQPSRVLDLACGPGLYTERLAALGHTCLGIDFSPASIAHASKQVEGRGLDCRYIEADIRDADFGEDHDLCSFVYGEFNSLRPEHAAEVLRRAHASLAPAGQIIVEAHAFDFVRKVGGGARRWYSAEYGLFSDRPHLVLVESFWDESQTAAGERFFVVDLESSAVERFATATRAYTEDEYRALFADAGFGDVAFLPGLGDAEEAAADGLLAVHATRR